MERIQVLINRILEAMDRSKADAEILRLPVAYTDGRGPPAVVRAVEEIHRTMDVVEIVSRKIEYLDELLEELQREIHLLRNSLHL
jgi:hypothetical protein